MHHEELFGQVLDLLLVLVAPGNFLFVDYHRHALVHPGRSDDAGKLFSLF
jgi:hypothetical protein